MSRTPPNDVGDRRHRPRALCTHVSGEGRVPVAPTERPSYLFTIEAVNSMRVGLKPRVGTERMRHTLDGIEPWWRGARRTSSPRAPTGKSGTAHRGLRGRTTSWWNTRRAAVTGPVEPHRSTTSIS